MRKKTRSLRRAFVYGCLVCLTVILISCVVIIIRSYITGKRSVEGYQQTALEEYVNYMESSRASYKDALSLLGYSSVTQQYLLSEQAAANYIDISYTMSSLSYAKNSIDGCVEIFLLSNTGKSINSSQYSSDDMDYSSLMDCLCEDYGLTSHKYSYSFFSEIYYSSDSGPYVFYIQTISNILGENADNFIIGAVLIDLSVWMESLQRLSPAEEGSYLIKAGDAYYSADSDYVTIDEDSSVVIRGASADINGRAFLADSMEDTDNTGWTVLFLYPESVFLRAIVSSLQFETMVFLFFLLSIFILYVVLSYYLKNLSSTLDNELAQISQDHLLQPNGIFSYSEFRPVMLSINEMLVRISEITKKESEANIRMYQSISRQKDAELYFLRTELNAHFLFNTLSAANSIALEHGDAEISDMTSRIANMFQYILFSPSIASFSEEIHMVSDYVAIIQKRASFSFDVSLDIEPSAYDWMVPTMFMQPLVEMSFDRYAVSRHDIPSVTEILAHIEDNRLIIQIQDRSCGIQAERLEKILGEMKEMDATDAKPGNPNEERSSITLKNIYYRLSWIYSDKFEMGIYSDSSSCTRVMLTLPEIPPETVDRIIKGSYSVI